MPPRLLPTAYQNARFFRRVRAATIGGVGADDRLFVLIMSVFTSPWGGGKRKTSFAKIERPYFFVSAIDDVYSHKSIPGRIPSCPLLDRLDSCSTSASCRDLLADDKIAFGPTVPDAFPAAGCSPRRRGTLSSSAPSQRSLPCVPPMRIALDDARGYDGTNRTRRAMEHRAVQAVGHQQSDQLDYTLGSPCRGSSR